MTSNELKLMMMHMQVEPKTFAWAIGISVNEMNRLLKVGIRDKTILDNSIKRFHSYWIATRQIEYKLPNLNTIIKGLDHGKEA